MDADLFTPTSETTPSAFHTATCSAFRTIVADPPWNYGCKKPTERPRPCVMRGEHPASANHYYDTMKLADIKAMPVAKLAADASVLFLWATVPLLPDAFDVMKAWGWKYKTMLTWHKTNRDCMGYWFRVCTEHLLVGVRGDVKAFRSMERTLLETPRGKHSQKPEAAYKLIESVTPEPRLELFARRKRLGWHAWGNEVPSDICMPNSVKGDKPRQTNGEKYRKNYEAIFRKTAISDSDTDDATPQGTTEQVACRARAADDKGRLLDDGRRRRKHRRKAATHD